MKELLAHSNLATTERYMGNFDTQKTDNALKQLFSSLKTDNEPPKDKKKEVIEMLKGLSHDEINEILRIFKDSSILYEIYYFIQLSILIFHFYHLRM